MRRLCYAFHANDAMLIAAMSRLPPRVTPLSPCQTPDYALFFAAVACLPPLDVATLCMTMPPFFSTMLMMPCWRVTPFGVMPLRALDMPRCDAATRHVDASYATMLRDAAHMIFPMPPLTWRYALACLLRYASAQRCLILHAAICHCRYFDDASHAMPQRVTRVAAAAADYFHAANMPRVLIRAID